MSGLTCFLDMDGVLVDFVAGACFAHGWKDPYEDQNLWSKWNFHHTFGVTDDEFYRPMVHQFWADLKPYPHFMQIVQACESAFPDQVYLLTTPSHNPESLSGKMAWIQKHLPHYSNRTLMGRCKHVVARPDAVLIDDGDHNINDWRVATGIGFLYPQPWNSACLKTLKQLELLVQFLNKYH